MPIKNNMKGSPHSKEHREKISKALKGRVPANINQLKKTMFKKGEVKFVGKNHPNWKGDFTGYHALHSWVNRWLGKPDACKNCGKSGLKGRQIHWANISGKYLRDLTDWIRLCVKCHWAFNRNNRGAAIAQRWGGNKN
jgi:hypothetical protein